MTQHSVTINYWDDNGTKRVRYLFLWTHDIAAAKAALTQVYDVITITSYPSKGN